MAKPIAATPTLHGKDARDFLRRMKEDENKPLCLVPTPKIHEAIALAFALTKK